MHSSELQYFPYLLSDTSTSSSKSSTRSTNSGPSTIYMFTAIPTPGGKQVLYLYSQCLSCLVVEVIPIAAVTGGTVGGIVAVILIAIITILLTVYCIYRRSKGTKSTKQEGILTTQDNVAYSHHTIANEPSNIESTVNITDNIAYGHVTNAPPTTTTAVPVYDTVQ